MTLRNLAGALLLSALFLPTAQAQETLQPFEQVSRNVNAPQTFGQTNLVAKSAQEAQQKGFARLVPAAKLSAVDFSRDMLIAVFRGRQSTGGYSVNVERIAKRPLMTTQPIVGGGPRWLLRVEVKKTSPAPGAMVTMATTNAYQVVKTTKLDALITYTAPRTSPPPIPSSFTDITRRVVVKPASSLTGPQNPGSFVDVQVWRDGRVRITSGSVGAVGMAAPLDGRASLSERRQLATAIAQARFHQIPRDLGNAGPATTPRFTYRVIGTPQGDRKISGVKGSEGQYAARLNAVGAALDRIRDRLRATPSSVFQSLELNTRRGSFTKSIHVAHDGKVRVVQTSPAIFFTPVNGQASGADLAGLRRLVRAAGLSSIPANLSQPVPGALPFVLDAKSNVSSNHKRINGTLGHYSTYDLRLRPLVETIARIGQQVLDNASGGNEAKGVVEARQGSQGQEVWLKESPRLSYKVSPQSFANTLLKFRGRLVKLSGSVRSTGSQSAEITATGILYPLKKTLRGVVTSKLELRQRSPLPTLSTFGPASVALRRAVGNRVSLNVYVFTGTGGVATEAYVEDAAAEATRDARVYSRRGRYRVTQGQALHVERSLWGYLYVRAQSGRKGWVRASAIQIGERIQPAIQPVPTQTPKPGLSGGLQGSGK